MKIHKNALSLILSQHGFTLAESIIVLSIFTMILSFYPLIIQSFRQLDHLFSPEENYEWNLFLIEVRQEIRNSTECLTANDQLSLLVNSSKITYEKYTNHIRRRVEDSGHEIVLQKVKSVSFQSQPTGIYLLVVFESGREKEAFFSFRVMETSRNQPYSHHPFKLRIRQC